MIDWPAAVVYVTLLLALLLGFLGLVQALPWQGRDDD